MISFASDYIAGAHELVLQRLVETNSEKLTGYGTDIYSVRAAEKIRQACGAPDAEVYFLVGGTQTNQFVIDSLLEPFEGVIAAHTGHVSVHEAGAIEYTGHKVLELEGVNGKISTADIRKLLDDFYEDESHDHMVCPGMVYISYPTEYGTLYSKQELKEIYEVCQTSGLPLFIDGARLAYGLASYESDISLPELATLCDVFYIGGTKAGALCGEAVVYTNTSIVPRGMTARIKQHGALLAKGRLTGVQFDALFTDDLYMRIGRQAIAQAEKLKAILRKHGCEFFIDSPTNQQFVVLGNDLLEQLSKEVSYGFWEKLGNDRSVVRFATSWSTTDADLEALDAALGKLI